MDIFIIFLYILLVLCLSVFYFIVGYFITEDCLDSFNRNKPISLYIYFLWPITVFLVLCKSISNIKNVGFKLKEAFEFICNHL